MSMLGWNVLVIDFLRLSWLPSPFLPISPFVEPHTAAIFRFFCKLAPATCILASHNLTISRLKAGSQTLVYYRGRCSFISHPTTRSCLTWLPCFHIPTNQHAPSPLRIPAWTHFERHVTSCSPVPSESPSINSLRVPRHVLSTLVVNSRVPVYVATPFFQPQYHITSCLHAVSPSPSLYMLTHSILTTHTEAQTHCVPDNQIVVTLIVPTIKLSRLWFFMTLNCHYFDCPIN